MSSNYYRSHRLIDSALYNYLGLLHIANTRRFSKTQMKLYYNGYAVITFSIRCQTSNCVTFSVWWHIFHWNAATIYLLRRPWHNSEKNQYFFSYVQCIRILADDGMCFPWIFIIRDLCFTFVHFLDICTNKITHTHTINTNTHTRAFNLVLCSVLSMARFHSTNPKTAEKTQISPDKIASKAT